MLGITIALVSTVALGSTGAYVFLKTMQNFNPGRKRIQQDLDQFRLELQPFVSELAPWSKEELQQLSFNLINKSTKKQITTTTKGVFTTIYHEPVIAFAYRKYVSPKENALLYARTSDREFIYRIKNDEVELVIDNVLVGKIDSRGNLTNTKGNKTLAQISLGGDPALLPVNVGGKEMGSLTNPQKSGKFNPRAFEFLSDMNRDEEALFLSLAILEMFRRKASWG